MYTYRYMYRYIHYMYMHVHECKTNIHIQFTAKTRETPPVSCKKQKAKKAVTVTPSHARGAGF